jgi:hypothetical protein
LERFANRDYAIKRSDVRSRTIKSVLKAQRKLREDGVKDIEYISTVLGRLSEAFSREAVNTALAFGEADEAAAAASSSARALAPSSTAEDEDRRNKMGRTLSPTTVLDAPCFSPTVTKPAKSSTPPPNNNNNNTLPPNHRFYKAVNAPKRINLHFC